MSRICVAARDRLWSRAISTTFIEIPLADLFREIDEDLRRDRALRLWQRYGYWLGIGCGLIIIATGLYVVWQNWQEKRVEADSAHFTAAVAAAQAGTSDIAVKQLQVLAATGRGGFGLIARVEAAALQAQGSDKSGGLAALKAIADDSGVDPSYRGLAAVLWGLDAVDTAPREILGGELQPLTAPDNAWRFLAQETLALADLRAGDRVSAKKRYQSIADDLAAPQTQRARAAEIINDLQN